MLLPSVRAAISFANQLVLSCGEYCSELVMFSDESSDNEVPEGISWDSWKESTRQRYFSRSANILSVPSDAAAMPYQKAACYGYYPSYEVDSMQLIECKVCGAVLKEVGYGHHLRTRHARAKSPFSADDSQAFLLSPPHVTSPRHCEVNAPSPSFLKGSSTYPTTLCEEGERSYSRIFSTQYSIEQRDDLKLALRVSRREPSQLLEPSSGYLDRVPSRIIITNSVKSATEEQEKVVPNICNKKTLNGRLKSKKKKKRRPESSSSDDFSLDHFRSKKRLSDNKRQELPSLPSTSSNLNSICDSQAEKRLVNIEDFDKFSSIETTQYVKDGNQQDAEKRSSESPEMLLDLLSSSKRATVKGHTSNSVCKRLRSFATASVKRSSGKEKSTNKEVSLKRSLRPPCSLSPEVLPQIPANCTKDEFSFDTDSACGSFIAEEEKPPVLKPEVYITKPEAHKMEQEPLVVEACGSNTFILSSKGKRRSINCVETDYVSSVTPEQRSLSGGCEGRVGNNDDSQLYAAVQNGSFDRHDYVPNLHLYRSGISNGFLDVRGDQNLAFYQHSYCSEEDLDINEGSDDVACTSKGHQRDGMSASASFSSGNVTLNRDSTSSNLFTIRRRPEKENSIVLKKQFPECQPRNQQSHLMKPPVWRKNFHRSHRHSSTIAFDLPSVPRKRMIFAQRKHDDCRYSTARVAIAKMLGTQLGYPKFEKGSPPFVCSEEVQYDPCRSVAEVCFASTSESLNNGSLHDQEEALPSDPYMIPLSSASSFLLKGDESTGTGAVNDSSDVRQSFDNNKVPIDEISANGRLEAVEEGRHNYMPRNIHVSGNSMSGTHFISGHQLFQVLPPAESQVPSTFYTSSDNISGNSLPPSLSPQQSFCNLQFGHLSSEAEPNHLIASEIETSHSRDGTWNLLNFNNDIGQIAPQANRKIVETPPVLKRMLTTTTESSQHRESASSGESLPLSEPLRCFVRQHGELRTTADLPLFPDFMDADDNSGTSLTCEGERSDALSTSSIYRIGSGSVSFIKPSILASGNKRYKLLPSIKPTPYGGTSIYTQASQPNIRLPATATPYLDAHLTQDLGVSSVVAQSRRVGQRPTSVPVLDRYSSSSPCLSGLSSLYAVSPSSLQSSDDAACVSSLVPKTRMC